MRVVGRVDAEVRAEMIERSRRDDEQRQVRLLRHTGRDIQGTVPAGHAEDPGTQGRVAHEGLHVLALSHLDDLRVRQFGAEPLGQLGRRARGGVDDEHEPLAGRGGGCVAPGPHRVGGLGRPQRPPAQRHHPRRSTDSEARGDI